MKIRLVLLLIPFVFVACDRQSAVQERLDRIPPAPATLSAEQEFKLTPILMVTSRGAFILRNGVAINRLPAPIPFDQVLVKLSELPPGDWPFGRVIDYTGPFGQTSESDPRAEDQGKIREMESELKAAGIRLDVHMSL